MAYGYIYKIENIVNGKVYIGQSINVKNRWRAHKRNLRRDRHGRTKYVKRDHLQCAWNKYGEENFIFEIIDEADDAFSLDNLEVFWISAYGGYESNLNYNKSSGGGVFRQNEETRKAISSARIEYFKDPKNRVGHPRDAECRRKISEKAKGRKCSEEFKIEHSKRMKGSNNPFYGKTHSEETRRIISEKNKGKHHSKETKQKMSDNNSGDKNPRARTVECIETGEVFTTIKEAASKYNINPSGLSSHLHGKKKHVKGYHFRFVD